MGEELRDLLEGLRILVGVAALVGSIYGLLAMGVSLVQAVRYHETCIQAGFERGAGPRHPLVPWPVYCFPELPAPPVPLKEVRNGE